MFVRQRDGRWMDETERMGEAARVQSDGAAAGCTFIQWKTSPFPPMEIDTFVDPVHKM